jgi:hypothetical protein
MRKLTIFIRFTCYSAGDKIEKKEMGRACGAYGEGRGIYRFLVGKHQGKSPLERPGHRREDNFNIDLQEVTYGGMDWTELAQDRDS